MPIQVICPGCHAHFKVSDKFAGKVGPCPKCKTSVTIPAKADEVVIHGPEEYGPKGSEGVGVLKPIERTEKKYSTGVIVGIVVTCVFIPLVALILRFMTGGEGNVHWAILAAGAIVLAPPLVWAGYAFFRNDELEPYEGSSLVIRVAICAVVYAGLWGLYAVVNQYALGGNPPELWQLLYVLPVLFVPGSLASLATLDLDATSAALHYGMYLLVTVGLRLIMAMTPL
jgi:hypothetical protein